VLYVEDELALLEVAMVFIEAEGISCVDTFTSAEAALFALGAQKYDAIVSDYQMPGMNGIQFLKAIREMGDNTPFILFTGRGREEVVIEALNNGADFYLQKGGDPRSQFAELTHAIRQLVSQKRSETALRESEERYRSFLQNFKGIAFRSKFDLTPLFFHGALGSMTAYPEEDIRCGRVKWDQIVHPEDLEKLWEGDTSLRNIPGFSVEREYRIVRKNGEVRWVHEVATNVLDESGRPQAVEGVIHDITDRKMAEEAVTHNLEHFKALIENVSDVIAVIDTSGLIRYVSPSVTRILGHEAGELMGTSVLDLLHPDDVAYLEEMISKVFKNEQIQPVADCRARCKDGSWVILEVSGELSDDFDQGPRIIVNARDATERRRIQDALMLSERKFREFVERACDGIAIVQDSTLKYVNQRLAEMLGYTVEEMLAKNFADFIWPDELAKVASHYSSRMAGEYSPFVYETVARKKDGSKLEIEINAGMFEYEGRPASSVIARDITERKETNRSLKESEERYRTIFENTGTATIIIEDDKTVSLANEEFVRLTGCPKEEIEGRLKTTDFVVQKDVETIAKYHELRRNDPYLAPHNCELGLLTKSGEVRTVLITIDLIPGTKKSIASLIDVTEKRNLERALEKQTGEQALLLDNIETMVWYATAPDTYGAVNRARAEFLGRKKEEIEGRKLPEVIPIAEECQACIASNTEVFEKKKTIHTEEWITTSKGERKLLALTKIPMLDENGNVKFVVCTGIDITEARRAEDELRVATKKLNLSESLLRHDILNQLSVIAGYAGMAAKQIKNPRLLKYISRIEDASKAIKKALEFAKDYQEVGTKAPVWKNPGKSLEGGLVGLDLQDVSLEADLDKVEIFADPMLDRVFHNLVDNACRHGNGVRAIRIHYERSGDDLRLICEDDGVGIPEDKKEKLFSNGHGLQMVRDILEMTGMTITEKGEHGKGARFEIDVPQGNYRFLD